MSASSSSRSRSNADLSRPLTREKIAFAAIDIVRREGQSALSMRRVASMFGVDVAALYRHVQNKDELLCEAGLEGQQLVLATQTVLHLMTSIAQSEVITRNTPRAQNRAFAQTIRAQRPEAAEKSWPATRARDAWSIDFDALFEFAMRTALESIVPANVHRK